MPLLSPRRIVPTQLQVRRCPTGLEPLNATVQWTVVRDGSTERLLNPASPFWRAASLRFSKLNMVDIAQLVSASDCGSEGRGFESHYPPHKVPISL